MIKIRFAGATLCLAIAAPLAAMPQTTPTAAPDATSTPAVELTDKEKTALERCKAMPYQQIAQSSKCTNLMKKAGITPAKPQQPRQ